MKFILGLLTGLVLGAVGAVAYSIQSGRDLRDTVEQIRAELDGRDMDVLRARFRGAMTQMQAQFDEKLGVVRGKASTTIDDMSDAEQSAVNEAADVASEDAGHVAEAAQDGAEEVADTARKGADKASRAAAKAAGTAGAAAK